jgi:RNA-dependent RNA polymerase
MDHLKEEGRKKYHGHMAEFEKFLHSSRERYKAQQGITGAGLYVDPALEAPWEQAMKRAERLLELDGNKRLMDELGRIRNHVQTVREKHKEMMRPGESSRKERNGHSSKSPRKAKPSFTSKPIEQRQNMLREVSLLFNQMPQEDDFIVLSPADVRRCRASYGEEVRAPVQSSSQTHNLLQLAYILETNNQEKRYPDSYSRFPFDVAMRELGIIKAESLGSCKMVNSSFYSAFNVTGAIKAFRSTDCPAYTYAP